jgi:SPP1 family phage portal protein
MNSEIEQFRLAYMAFYGSVPDDTTLKLARQTGAFGFPEKDMRMEFITKNINAVAVENHLQMLEKNIMYFSQSVRFTDEAFGGASGVAMKFKIFNLESKSKICERKFSKSLRKMMKALLGYFDRKGITYDPMEFEFVFVRNFPLDLMSEAQSLATLKGLVSDETAFAQMSFIKDPDAEKEKILEEQQEYMKYSAMLNPQPEVPLTGEETPPEETQSQEPGIPQEEESPEAAAFKAFGKVTGG